MKTAFAVCFGALAILTTSAAHGEVTLYPAPKNYPSSRQYRVFVNGQESFTYDTRVFFELNSPDRVVSFTQFDFQGQVDIEVSHLHCPDAAHGPVTRQMKRRCVLAADPTDGTVPECKTNGIRYP